MRSAVKKKTQTLEEEIEALVAQTDALRERADELLNSFADKYRPRNMPRDSVRRIWEAKSLVHCPILALKAGMKEVGFDLDR
jgi:hypothetical protein